LSRALTGFNAGAWTSKLTGAQITPNLVKPINSTVKQGIPFEDNFCNSTDKLKQ